MKLLRRLALPALLAVAAGCQPQYDGLRMRVIVGDGDALGNQITVEQGKAMVLEVRPESANPFEDYEKFNLVELESYNEEIVRIFPADDVDRFVILGAGLGRASVEISVDGISEDIIDAEVIEQEVSP
jgi:hypothetical protein